VGGRAAPVLLALLRAMITRARPFDWAAVPPSAIQQALEIGLGPVLAYVADNAGARRDLPFADRIRAAELTARVLTAGQYDTLCEVLTAARDIECRLVLLKGAATALRYYPAPHLRPMGDIDVLVPADRQPLLEARLRALGFQQRSNQPAAAFEGWHHSMPFYCSQRGTWIDVHSNVYPPQHPQAHDSLFSWEAITSQLSPVGIGKHTGYAMNHELQLVFTSARWAEEFDPARGIYPILDAALLIEKHRHTLDWDRILTIVRESWASTALHLMLTYLRRWDLALVPPEVLNTLAASDRHANRIFFRLLHRLVTMYAIEGRPFGLAATTEGHLRVVWSNLLRPMSPTANLFSVPYHLAWPPGHPERFSPLYAMRRVGAFARRAVLKGSEPAGRA
jgi:Uncharacterised nucleotidyltransferase